MTKITKLIFEWGMLRRIKHEGWRVAGIEHPDSVAEHSLRAAQIGYVLAKLEKYKDPNEVCSILVFHDIGECGIGDLHKIANRYVKADEERAVKDQLDGIDFGDDILKLWKQIEYKDGEAGIIAKDADLLEQAFTAKEFMEKGYEHTQNWIKNISNLIKTDSAKDLLEKLQKVHSNEWWQGLKLIQKQ